MLCSGGGGPILSLLWQWSIFSWEKVGRRLKKVGKVRWNWIRIDWINRKTYAIAGKNGALLKALLLIKFYDCRTFKFVPRWGATNVQLENNLKCPHCSHTEHIIMPLDYCQFFYECKSCHEIIKAEGEHCCVFCSYGDVPCPSVQSSA